MDKGREKETVKLVKLFVNTIKKDRKKISTIAISVILH